MRKEYNFSNAKRNPYIGKLKRQITIRLDKDVIEYFKKIAELSEIPYQKLINLYLRDCAEEERIPAMTWPKKQDQANRNERDPRR